MAQPSTAYLALNVCTGNGLNPFFFSGQWVDFGPAYWSHLPKKLHFFFFLHEWQGVTVLIYLSKFKPSIHHIFLLVWPFFPFVWALFPLEWTVFPCVCWISLGSQTPWLSTKETSLEWLFWPFQNWLIFIRHFNFWTKPISVGPKLYKHRGMSMPTVQFIWAIIKRKVQWATWRTYMTLPARGQKVGHTCDLNEKETIYDMIGSPS